jgi:predicted ATPase
MEPGLNLVSLKRISLLEERVQDWNVFPFSIPTIRSLAHLDISSRVCFFVGENGTGKSTLIEAIADCCGYGREGGSKNIFYTTTGHDDRTVTHLARALRLIWTNKILTGYYLRAESFFNIATHLDQLQKEDPRTLRSYGGQSLHEQSHGESFLSLLKNRCSGPGFYLFDEPEAALSPQRQLALLVILNDALKANTKTQFLIATHSPILLAYPGAQIYSFDGGKLGQIQYHETESYKIMSGFLANPNGYLHQLLRDQE